MVVVGGETTTTDLASDLLGGGIVGPLWCAVAARPTALPFPGRPCHLQAVCRFPSAKPRRGQDDHPPPAGSAAAAWVSATPRGPGRSACRRGGSGEVKAWVWWLARRRSERGATSLSLARRGASASRRARCRRRSGRRGAGGVCGGRGRRGAGGACGGRGAVPSFPPRSRVPVAAGAGPSAMRRSRCGPPGRSWGPSARLFIVAVVLWRARGPTHRCRCSGGLGGRHGDCARRPPHHPAAAAAAAAAATRVAADAAAAACPSLIFHCLAAGGALPLPHACCVRPDRRCGGGRRRSGGKGAVQRRQRLRRRWWRRPGRPQCSQPMRAHVADERRTHPRACHRGSQPTQWWRSTYGRWQPGERLPGGWAG